MTDFETWPSDYYGLTQVNECGVLVVGQKKSGKLWALGKEGIKEVDEYK